MAGISRIGVAVGLACIILATGCWLEDESSTPRPPLEEQSSRVGPNGEWVQFVSPGHGDVVTNPVTFRVAASGVATVAIDAEGWHLGDPWDPSHVDTFTYAFYGTGCPRYMTLSGFDVHGQVVATHKITITVADDVVRIDAPSDGDVVHNPVTFHISAPTAALVSISADGWQMHEWSPQTTTEFTYEFNYTATPRKVTLTGFDSHDHVIGSHTITISFQDSGSNDDNDNNGGNNNGGSGGNPLNVPYFYQYDNAYEPGATCGLTSAAMLLNYFDPGSETPDHLYTTYGKAQGQSPGSLAQLYTYEGLHSDYTYGGTRQMIEDQIDAGRPVLVHTFLTGAGHIIAIVGYDGSGWIVNDPAGDWYQCYGCGASGDGVHYPFGGGADDALSHDGDIWMSSGDTSPFSL